MFDGILRNVNENPSVVSVIEFAEYLYLNVSVKRLESVTDDVVTSSAASSIHNTC